MTVTPTTELPTGQEYAQDCKQETAKRWLTRQLAKPVSRQGIHSTKNSEVAEAISSKRPRTAPSTGTAHLEVPAVPQLAERPSTQEFRKVPFQPLRSDSGVMRDVNAWLDSSHKPASPLMGGLSYWREGSVVSAGNTGNIQYAIPVFREPNLGSASTTHGLQLKSFCRRAKKMQVRMPSMRRTEAQRVAIQNKVNRRSISTPLLAIGYDQAPEGSPPTFYTRMGAIPDPSVRPATTNTSAPVPHFGRWTGVAPAPLLDVPPCHGSPASARFAGSECSMERRVNAVPSQTASTCVSLRPVMAADRVIREDSVGSLSDAPTYFSGPPPPSYRSRAASIITTSSFGCVDGMNPEQRQLSQKRAQKNRGVKGKLKKMAQKAGFTK